MNISHTPTEGQALIGDQWTPGTGQSWQRISPAYGCNCWEGSWSDAAQAAQALTAARKAFPVWSEVALEERMNICKRFADAVKAESDELAKLIALETGKPLWEAKTEIAACIGKVSNSIDAILKRRWTTTQDMGPLMAVTRYRPHGVLLVLGPFNLPAHLPGAHIIPALLAGNAIVFKPSELAPATGQKLVQLWQQAQLPAGVLNLVHGGAEVATALVDSDETDGVLFTGSHRVGTMIHRRLAGKPEKILALELGGNNPLIIHETENVSGAAITTILSAYITSGQRCTCARRLIVVGSDLHSTIVQQLEKLLPQVLVGLPLDAQQPFMGPLIHSSAAEELLAAQGSLETSGGQVVVPLQVQEQCEALLSPGLVNVDKNAILEDTEHFGPLLTIQAVDDLDEAIELANRTRFGLSAGFIGDRVEDFHYFLHRIRAGVVNWNRQTTGASGKLPFGGVGSSGNHQPSGYFASDYCSYPMASLESHSLSDDTSSVPGLEHLEVQ